VTGANGAPVTAGGLDTCERRGGPVKNNGSCSYNSCSSWAGDAQWPGRLWVRTADRSIATRPHGATSIILQITLADIWTTFQASSRPPASTAACPMIAAVATNWQIELRTLDSTQVVHSDVHAVQHDGNGTCMQSCTCTDRCTNVPPILSTTAAHKPNHYFSGSYAVRTQATSLQPLTVALYPQEGVVT